MRPVMNRLLVARHTLCCVSIKQLITDVLTTTYPPHQRRTGMTEEEYMEQIEQEWSRIDDDPDLFDELSFFEEFAD